MCDEVAHDFFCGDGIAFRNRCDESLVVTHHELAVRTLFERRAAKELQLAVVAACSLRESTVACKLGQRDPGNRDSPIENAWPDRWVMAASSAARTFLSPLHSIRLCALGCTSCNVGIDKIPHFHDLFEIGAGKRCDHRAFG